MSMLRRVLRLLIFSRLASFGCLAVSTHDEAQRHLEVTPTAASRIVRHEQLEGGVLIQVGQGNAPMELDPAVMGQEASTTEIVQSGVGPTTTAIYAEGTGPLAGPAPNAVDLTPAPPTYYEPGPPGIPGPPGMPGPPGDPGPGLDGLPWNGSDSPVLNASAGDYMPPLSVHTQSGYEIRGPPGLKGPKGDVGPEGVIGSIGPDGMLGERGSEGPPGPRGETGPQGKTKHPWIPPQKWMYYGLGINLLVALIALRASYLEFVENKSPMSHMCPCCAKRKKAAADGKKAESGEEGEENWGGYENQ